MVQTPRKKHFWGVVRRLTAKMSRAAKICIWWFWIFSFGRESPSINSRNFSFGYCWFSRSKSWMTNSPLAQKKYNFNFDEILIILYWFIKGKVDMTFMKHPLHVLKRFGDEKFLILILVWEEKIVVILKCKILRCILVHPVVNSLSRNLLDFWRFSATTVQIFLLQNGR